MSVAFKKCFALVAEAPSFLYAFLIINKDGLFCVPMGVLVNDPTSWSGFNDPILYESLAFMAEFS